MQFVNLLYQNDYVIVHLDRGKANPLNHQMIKEIRQAFQEMAEDDDVKGVILTGQAHFFSVGLDVIELYKYDKAEITAFFKDFSGMFMDLMRFPKPFVAAINGHCPAGGTVMVLGADYRVMAQGEQYLIGLNEVSVNIVISENIPKAYAALIGERLAYQSILEGKLFNPESACSIGLVDKIVPLSDVLTAAKNQMETYLEANYTVLLATKRNLRKELLKRIDINMEERVEEMNQYWWQEDIRAKMKLFVDGLVASKKNKVAK